MRTHRSAKAFACGAPGGGGDHVGADGCEDVVEGSYVLDGAVADHGPDCPLVGDGEVAGGLGGPGSGGVGGYAGEMDASGVDLDDEQDVESAQGDGVDTEEVGGDQGVGLAADELAPGWSDAVWCGFASVVSEDLPHGGGGDAVSEAAEFAVDAPVASGRFLGVETQDETAGDVALEGSDVRWGASTCVAMAGSAIRLRGTGWLLVGRLVGRVKDKASMFCISCGSPLGDYWFCTGCGEPVATPESGPVPPARQDLSNSATPLEFAPTSGGSSVPPATVCRACSSSLSPGDRFCTSCGSPTCSAPAAVPDEQQLAPVVAPGPDPTVSLPVAWVGDASSGGVVAPSDRRRWPRSVSLGLASAALLTLAGLGALVLLTDVGGRSLRSGDAEEADEAVSPSQREDLATQTSGATPTTEATSTTEAPTTTEPTTQSSTSAPSAIDAQNDGSGRAGTFDNPHGAATGVQVYYTAGDGNSRRWVIEIVELALDIGAEVNNRAAQSGNTFAIARLRIRNQAPAMDAPLAELRFDAVGPDGTVVEREASSCAPSADSLDSGAILSRGDSIEGTVCWEVPVLVVAELLLGVESTEVTGRVHIRLHD